MIPLAKHIFYYLKVTGFHLKKKKKKLSSLRGTKPRWYKSESVTEIRSRIWYKKHPDTANNILECGEHRGQWAYSSHMTPESAACVRLEESCIYFPICWTNFAGSQNLYSLDRNYQLWAGFQILLPKPETSLTCHENVFPGWCFVFQMLFSEHAK